MILDIPDFGLLRLEHLVLDYNGTLARDGELVTGVAERLVRLGKELQIHVVTADTFGKARESLASVSCRLTILERQSQAQAKRIYVAKLGRERTAAIGNGRNDRLMLKTAALGIATVQAEGAAREAVLAAHVVVRSVIDALDLLIEPMRLTATLRG